LTDVTIAPPRSPLPSWAPNRLNTRYAPALRLAELILADTAPNLRPGTAASVDGVIIDLETVFEAFLTTALHTAVQSLGLRCAPQEIHHSLDAARRVRIRPDIAVYRGPHLLTLVDAKYKTTDGLGTHPDLHQLTAYCTALGLAHGHLVYASGPDAPTAHRIGPAGTTVTVHALDLTAPPSTINEAIRVLAHQLANTIT
jgi:5-methylcytosine-specific restriction enzyme subunit McrC